MWKLDCLGCSYFGIASQQNIKSNSSTKYSEHKTQRVDVCNTGEYHPLVTSLLVECFRLQDLRLNSFQKMLMLWVPWSRVDHLPTVRLTHHLSRTIHNAQCKTSDAQCITCLAHPSLCANRWWAVGKSIFFEYEKAIRNKGSHSRRKLPLSSPFVKAQDPLSPSLR